MGNLEKTFTFVCDELDGAEKYARFASKKKALGENMLAGIAVRVANIEMEHAKMWYEAIQQLVKDMRSEYQKMNQPIPEIFEDRVKSMAEYFTKTTAEVNYMIELVK